MSYCLFCGYDRRELGAEHRCPECGKPDAFEQQRQECAALARRPLRLLMRVMTLRRLPAGWFEVIDEQTFRNTPPLFRGAGLAGISALMFLLFLLAGGYVRIERVTNLVNRSGNILSPTITEVPFEHEYMTLSPIWAQGSIAPPGGQPPHNVMMQRNYGASQRILFSRVPLGSIDSIPWTIFAASVFSGWIFVLWLVLRYRWLPAMLRTDTTDDPGLAPTAKRAADLLAIMPLAQVLWLAAICAADFVYCWFRPGSLVRPVASDNVFAILRGSALVFLPIAMWWQALRADPGGRIFPRKLFAVGVLTMATMILFACWYVGFMAFTLFVRY